MGRRERGRKREGGRERRGEVSVGGKRRREKVDVHGRQARLLVIHELCDSLGLGAPDPGRYSEVGVASVVFCRSSPDPSNLLMVTWYTADWLDGEEEDHLNRECLQLHVCPCACIYTWNYQALSSRAQHVCLDSNILVVCTGGRGLLGCHGDRDELEVLFKSSPRLSSPCALHLTSPRL